MKEIGGFFELELNRGRMYHKNALAFNSGANALFFFFNNSDYQTVYLPYFTCDVVIDVAVQLNLDIIFYRLDTSLRPIVDISKLNDKTVLIYNNYFGICEEQIGKIARKTKHLIIDAAQAFYYIPKKNMSSFNSVRKFFGVPDGGFLYGFKPNTVKLYEQLNNTTYECNHLFKRHELGAQKSYLFFKQNEEVLINNPIGKMSHVTRALLANVDFDIVKQSRINNFNTIHDYLASSNELKLGVVNGENVPLCYPYLCQNGDLLKQFLISKGVFVPTYWPNVKKLINDDSFFEVHLCENLVCLPIDQRYDFHEMRFIIETINRFEHA